MASPLRVPHWRPCFVAREWRKRWMPEKRRASRKYRYPASATGAPEHPHLAPRCPLGQGCICVPRFLKTTTKKLRASFKLKASLHPRGEKSLFPPICSLFFFVSVLKRYLLSLLITSYCAESQRHSGNKID